MTYFSLEKKLVLLKIFKQLVMKNTLYVILVSLLVFSSCQVDNDSLQDETLDSNLELIISQEESNSESRSEPDFHQRYHLERNLQWISYLSGATVIRSQSARNEFILKLSGSDRINLNDLIGEEVPDSSPFKAAFINQLRFHITAIIDGCRPEQSRPSQPGGIPGGSPDNDDGVPGIIASDDISSLNRQSDIQVFNDILDISCVELFVPEVIPTFNVSRILTTAHPLNYKPYNSGFVISNTVIGLDLCGNTINSYGTIVNDSYTTITDFLFVARPFRSIGSFECTYPEYSDIDFTEFLN